MEKTKTNCTGMDLKLADLLLDPTAVPAKVQTHVAECDRCQAELAELKATMALLDTWEAP
jgi:anti-sigma factor RsiW